MVWAEPSTFQRCVFGGLWRFRDQMLSWLQESHVVIWGSWQVQALNCHITTRVVYVTKYKKCTQTSRGNPNIIFVFVNHKHIQVVCVCDAQISGPRINFVFVNHKHIISLWLKNLTIACSEEHAKYYFYHDSSIDHSVIILAMQYISCISSFFSLMSFVKGIKHSRYWQDVWKPLSIEERQRWYRKIPWCALIPLKLSPWWKLLELQNNQAFITMMRFDTGSFDKLFVKFGPMFLDTCLLMSLEW